MKNRELNKLSPEEIRAHFDRMNVDEFDLFLDNLGPKSGFKNILKALDFGAEFKQQKKEPIQRRYDNDFLDGLF